ncbi:MAG: rhomboid family intramembrane serine protease [Halobacteriovoraceae bacterium]|nr:rhomboid family intramembrane serine protease [Halobacteriovoraceae bacterium]
MAQIHTPKLTSTNKILIIFMVLFFVLGAIMEKNGLSLIGILGLTANGVFQGAIYQLFTWPFIGRGLLEVVFNCLLLWFLGSELENMWGKRRYLVFVLWTIMGAGIIFLGLSLFFFSGSSLALTGMAGLVDALLLAYAILFPDRVFHFMLIIPVQAKYFCMILIGMQLYFGFFSSAAVLAWGQLAAMACAFCYMILVSSPTLKKLFTFSQRRKARSNHLKLVKKNGDRPPKYWQ